MDFEQLKNFITVADCRSFSKAEESAYISKQALIKQINNLEAEVGTPLFTREKSGVTLTASGEVFYRGAKSLIKDRDALVTEALAAANTRKILRVSQVEHQRLLTPVTEEFRKRYPEVEIVPTIHPNHAGEWRVANDVSDVGETFYAEDFEKIHPGLQFTLLKEFPYCAVMNPSHPLSQKETVSLGDVSEYNVTVFDQITDNNVLDVMKKSFAADRFDIRRDVDNMIGVTFDVCGGDGILITHNPYIYYMTGIRIIPLDTGWKVGHGIILSRKPSKQAEDYLAVAKEIFGVK